MADRPPSIYMLLDSNFHPVRIFTNKTQAWNYISSQARFMPATINSYSKFQKALCLYRNISFPVSIGLAYVSSFRIDSNIPQFDGGFDFRPIR